MRLQYWSVSLQWCRDREEFCEPTEFRFREDIELPILPNQIYAGNCIKKLSQVTAGSVDLVFADPPFNIGYEYDVYDDRKTRKDYVAWSQEWMKGVFRCLKSSGTFWLAIGDEFAADLKVLAQNEIGFHCRSWVIWYYMFGVNCVNGFSRSHTHLLHFVKDPDDFVFNAQHPAVRVPSARQLVYADRRANPNGRLPDNTWIFRPQDAPEGGFSQGHDTWYFPRVAGTFKEREGFHGCQMPEQLLGRIVRVSSNPLDVVLDPFAGSGTTLAVAKKLGRQWMGFELSGNYVKWIKERMKSIQPGDKLTGPENPLSSAPSTAKGKKRGNLRIGRSIPHADKETERAMISAFKKTSQGFSTDHLLCDPELNQAFLKECKRLGIPGAGFVWNRLLLRIRKSGKLPKVTRKRTRLTFAEMDPYSFASEIAMRQLELDYGYELDDILCNPKAVQEFGRIAEQYAPGYAPFEYRWAALSIRKRAMKSKVLAREKFSAWKSKPLPKLKPIEKWNRSSLERPGVYLFARRGQSLYIGESRNVRNRIDLLEKTETWNKLGLSAMGFIQGEKNTLHGLQSRLVCRENPLLNSKLLFAHVGKNGDDK